MIDGTAKIIAEEHRKEADACAHYAENVAYENVWRHDDALRRAGMLYSLASIWENVGDRLSNHKSDKEISGLSAGLDD
jgi:hypothetical protein